ncbi:hypothetical protein FSP39_015191 [Pinctada imbricata]|uniref:Mab-21-like nucleotidyltransferase domain-containing protein n=1 Tax=Pinctada imbricata TaxID=66713 RepID=A0AA88XZI1_PINIB|nr:hypothetical protein FSP39_015191 [Pinctada imbricata]
MARQGDIGSRLNEWRSPVYELGPSESDMTPQIKAAIGEINIADDAWMNTCGAIDKVLGVVISEFRKVASSQYPGLVIQDAVIRQGSSREGLKVRNPVEYDFMLPFKIEGVHLVHYDVYDCNGRILPGLLKMKVQNDHEMRGRFSWMNRLGIIDASGMLDSENIQKILFTSILDKFLNKINEHLARESSRTGDGYRVNRSTNSTNFQLTVQFEGSIRGVHDAFGFLTRNESFSILQSQNISTIDIDFVPGMLIGRDVIPNPYSVKEYHLETMVCERYAVMKWINKKNTNIKEADKSLLWRNSSSGYEKHVLDVARRNPSQRYILTACRILKAYIANEKAYGSYNDQLVAIVKSYYLKMLCFYCIVFLTVPNSVNRLSGVKEALGYMIVFLEKSLNAEYLPHFFHGNPWLSVILPGCYFEEESEKYNSFSEASGSTIQQARLSIKRLKERLQGLFLSEQYLDQEKIKMFTDILSQV